MQGLEALQNVNNAFPDLFLGDAASCFDVTIDELEDIASFGEFHDDAQAVGRTIVECFLELDDILVVEGGQYSNFIQCPIFLLFLHASELDLLQGVHFAINLPLDIKNLPESPFAQLLNDLELAQISLLIHIKLIK